MIVGPPGTGKTDTAVQIISNLYHNYPTHKIVLVTHSNAALNDLFEKIMERNVDGRHLLRLGSGERDLREALAAGGARGSGRGQGEEFTKQGRVNWCLERRLELLSQVDHLGQSLRPVEAPTSDVVLGDVGSTCETAEYFYIDEIKVRINQFEKDLKNLIDNKNSMLESESSTAVAPTVSDIFPFHQYFSDVPEALFTGNFKSFYRLYY